MLPEVHRLEPSENIPLASRLPPLALCARLLVETRELHTFGKLTIVCRDTIWAKPMRMTGGICDDRPHFCPRRRDDDVRNGRHGTHTAKHRGQAPRVRRL